MALSKTVLITGGGSGIGRGLAKKFLQDTDYKIILWGRNLETLNETIQQVDNDTNRMRSFAVDIGDDTSRLAGFNKLESEDLVVDVLVNNAGILNNSPLLQMDQKNIFDHININALAPLELIKYFVPQMAANNYGRIVNMSSAWGSIELGLGPGAYGISKALLNTITIKSAEETSGNIKVNSCGPGWVRTEMGGSTARLSIEDALPTPFWLATLDETGPNGGFFQDMKPISW